MNVKASCEVRAGWEWELTESCAWIGMELQRAAERGTHAMRRADLDVVDTSKWQCW